MLVVMDLIPRFIIDQKAIDLNIGFAGWSAEEFCKRRNFDYKLFNRIYNNDLSITIEELIQFAKVCEMPLREFVIIV